MSGRKVARVRVRNCILNLCGTEMVNDGLGRFQSPYIHVGVLQREILDSWDIPWREGWMHVYLWRDALIDSLLVTITRIAIP